MCKEEGCDERKTHKCHRISASFGVLLFSVLGVWKAKLCILGLGDWSFFDVGDGIGNETALRNGYYERKRGRKKGIQH